MNENPTPNDPPLSDEQRRIQELEAEVAKLQRELTRANEFKEGYWHMYAEKEDWEQVEREAEEAMAEPPVTLDQVFQRLHVETTSE